MVGAACLAGALPLSADEKLDAQVQQCAAVTTMFNADELLYGTAKERCQLATNGPKVSVKQEVFKVIQVLAARPEEALQLSRRWSWRQKYSFAWLLVDRLFVTATSYMRPRAVHDMRLTVHRDDERLAQLGDLPMQGATHGAYDRVSNRQPPVSRRYAGMLTDMMLEIDYAHLKFVLDDATNGDRWLEDKMREALDVLEAHQAAAFPGDAPGDLD